MIERAMRSWLFAIVLVVAPMMTSIAAPVTQEAGAEQTVTATAALVREIQFLLLSVGLDPGPIDGNAREMTNRAVYAFQQRSGLPFGAITNNRPIPAAFVERLRREAAQVLLKGTQTATAPAAPAPAPAETVAVAPKPALPPAPDRFAGCTYSPADFKVGGKQYTPQSFLDEGFDGVTSRAVTNLRQRLDEARQIADKIGGPALIEVQRQAHVLAYFECRQKIEQASATKQ